MNSVEIVLFYCEKRTGHFGQGSFTKALLTYFKTRAYINVTLIKTDCDDIAKVFTHLEDGITVIAVPRLTPDSMLIAANQPFQKIYAQRIVGTIYPYLKDKSNLLFWVNSIDYLNVFYELKSVLPGCKLMYVHHSFSWKYLINIADHVFVDEWKKGNNSFHPIAFEMTKYQQEMALLADRVITVTNHAKDFFRNMHLIFQYIKWIQFITEFQ